MPATAARAAGNHGSPTKIVCAKAAPAQAHAKLVVTALAELAETAHQPEILPRAETRAPVPLPAMSDHVHLPAPDPPQAIPARVLPLAHVHPLVPVHRQETSAPAPPLPTVPLPAIALS